MSFYESLANTAQALIASKGKDVTFTRITGATFDPVAGSYSGGTPDAQTIKAVSLPASGGKIQALDVRYGLQGQVFRKYAFLMIAGNDISWEPEPGHTVSLDSETWTVLGVTPTRPNVGNGIIYNVALRQ